MICQYLALKRRIHVSARVLGACVAGAVFLAGCDGEKPSEPSPESRYEMPSPAEYMKDPAFRAALDAQRAAKKRLQSACENVRAELARLAEAQRTAMPGATEAAVEKELEKNPEWNSLRKRFADAEAALEDNRQQTLRIVRERTAPKKISK